MSKKATIILCTKSESETKKLEEFLLEKNLLSKIRVIPKYELDLQNFKTFRKNVPEKLRNEVYFLKECIENNPNLKEYLGDFYIVNMGEKFELKVNGKKYKINSNTTFKDIKKKCSTFNVENVKSIWTSYIFLYHSGHSYAYNYRINGCISEVENGKKTQGKNFLKIFVPIKKNKNLNYQTYASLSHKEMEEFDPYLKMIKTLVNEISSNSKEIFL